MSHRLILGLQLQEQTPDFVRVQLGIHNDSKDKLHVPSPRALGLRFRDVRTGKDAKLKLHSEFMIGGTWEGFTLRPGEKREFPLAVVLHEAAPGVYAGCGHCEECWRVELEPGDYDVVYKLRMEPDGYCLDAQYDMGELQRLARADKAVVWVGETVSHPLHIVHQAASPVAQA